MPPVEEIEGSSMGVGNGQERQCSERKKYHRNYGYCHRLCSPHSHSIVPGGLLVMSYTTRLTPFTSLMIRVAVAPRKDISN